MDIEWEDPPPTKANGWGKTKNFVDELAKCPGKWARYPTALSTSLAAQNRRRWPGTEWTARRRPDGKYDLFGRWVGES